LSHQNIFKQGKAYAAFKPDVQLAFQFWLGMQCVRSSCLQYLQPLFKGKTEIPMTTTHKPSWQDRQPQKGWQHRRGIAPYLEVASAVCEEDWDPHNHRAKAKLKRQKATKRQTMQKKNFTPPRSGFSSLAPAFHFLAHHFCSAGQLLPHPVQLLTQSGHLSLVVPLHLAALHLLVHTHLVLGACHRKKKLKKEGKKGEKGKSLRFSAIMTGAS